MAPTTGYLWLAKSESDREALALQYYGAVLAGSQWSDKTITWSAPSGAYGYVTLTPAGQAPIFTAFSSQDVQQAQSFFDYLSSIIDLKFSFTATAQSDVRMGYENMTVGGYAYYPPNGSLYISDTEIGTLSTAGSYGYLTLIHETGHALGLKHPESYNASGGTTPGPYLPISLDTTEATVMSYSAFVLWGQPLGTAGSWYYAQSYMPIDIQALLQMYGAATGIARSQFTFSFSQTSAFSYGASSATVNMFAPFYLYDANHDVTLDFSQLNDPAERLNVDLNAGGISYTQGNGLQFAQYNGFSGAWDPIAKATSNIYNTNISSNTNVTTIVGSPLNDSVTVGLRSVSVNGGAGVDTIVYGDTYADCTIAVDSTGTVTIVDKSGQVGTLHASSVELIRFSDRALDPNNSNNRVLDLSQSSDTTIVGTATGDSIYLGASFHAVDGAKGNDAFYVGRHGSQDYNVEGGTGFDTVFLPNPRSSYTILASSSDLTEVTGLEGHGFLRDIERVQFADQSLNRTPYSPAFFTAYAGTLRVDPTAGMVSAIAGASNPVALGEYVDRLIVQAGHSTIPALIATQFIEGSSPLSDRLDALATFASNQFQYYSGQHVTSPELGPYEALGMGLSGTPQFAQRFSMLDDVTFVKLNYQAVFGRAATSDQVNHFEDQMDYFSDLYLGAGIASDLAHLRARGAALGQMLGFAAQDQGNDFAIAAKAFLVDASDGEVAYGTSLMNWLV